jgi:uncharacterized Zn finger protein (UPF0148 family)
VGGDGTSANTVHLHVCRMPVFFLTGALFCTWCTGSLDGPHAEALQVHVAKLVTTPPAASAPMPSTPASDSAKTNADAAIQSSAALGKVSGNPAVNRVTTGNQSVLADKYLSNIALQARDLLLYGLFKNDKVIPCFLEGVSDHL